MLRNTKKPFRKGFGKFQTGDSLASIALCDFIQLPRANGFQYALVCRDQFTHWVEAFPCHHATALETSGHLFKDVVPKFGVPSILDIDQGKHFVYHVF